MWETSALEHKKRCMHTVHHLVLVSLFYHHQKYFPGPEKNKWIWSASFFLPKLPNSLVGWVANGLMQNLRNGILTASEPAKAPKGLSSVAAGFEALSWFSGSCKKMGYKTTRLYAIGSEFWQRSIRTLQKLFSWASGPHAFMLENMPLNCKPLCACTYKGSSHQWWKSWAVMV